MIHLFRAEVPEVLGVLLVASGAKSSASVGVVPSPGSSAIGVLFSDMRSNLSLLTDHFEVVPDDYPA
jgi:hypothetical protein